MKELVSAKSTSKQEKLDMLGFEVSYGSVHGWTVEVSTLPQQRGAPLMHKINHAPSSCEVQMALRSHTKIELGAFPPKGGWCVDC